MNKKKVLFVATITNHIIKFHIPYLKWFKEQGYEVHVASHGDTSIDYCDIHYNLPFARFPFKKINFDVYKELKKIIEDNKYQIIHCNTPVGGVVTRLAARKARRKGTKVIYTAHGFHFYKGAPLANWLIYYPIEKIMAKHTDCLITITKEDYDFAKKHLESKKIEHINGIGMNTKRFEKNVSEQEQKNKRKELEINEKDIVLTYVAEINKNKNQILLINVVDKLKDSVPEIKLLLVGKGNLMEEYKELVKNKKLDENIKVLGKRNDINEILSITDIYVASSIREGLPVNIMEAMYKELPIIATDNRGHRELIINNENGYIACNDIKSFVEDILELINDNCKKKKLGIKGKELSRKYELSKILKEMERIYKECLK